MKKMNDKREEFERLTAECTNSILRRLGILSSCSDKRLYDYTERDINQIFSTIEREIELTKRRFKSPEDGNSKLGGTPELGIPPDQQAPQESGTQSNIEKDLNSRLENIYGVSDGKKNDYGHSEIASDSTRGYEHRPQPQKRKKIKGYTLYGELYGARNWKEAMIGIFNKFIEKDREFVNRFRRMHPQYWNDTRQLIVDRQDEVYLKSPHLIKHARQLDNGQYMDTNLSQDHIETRIKDACKVMGFRYGDDLDLHEM